MVKKGISQETLKLIACVTMLIDHVGATLFYSPWFRIIGRISFPIFCFLLTEGMAYTRDPKRYCVRLMIGAALAELPYELLFYGQINIYKQSVMVTLVLGMLMILWARKQKNFILPLAVCFVAAEYLGTDYGGWGIALIAVFAMTTNLSGGWLIQLVGMAVIFWAMGSSRVIFGELQIPLQMFGLLALIPIRFYSGRKITKSKGVQTAFYLFYPVHMAVLLVIRFLLMR